MGAKIDAQDLSFERAVKVIPKVRLKGVNLVGTKCFLAERLWALQQDVWTQKSSPAEQEKLRADKEVEERLDILPQTREGFFLKETKPVSRNFWVICDFGVRYVTPEEEILFEHEAKFCLHYSLKTRKGLSRKDLLSFAKFNAPHNAWPYWRELVHNISARMPIPPIVVPLRPPPQKLT